MPKHMRMFLIVAACCFAVPFVGQVFCPEIGGEGTVWGMASGWQREIGFWNLFALAPVLGTLKLGDINTARILVLSIVPS